MGFSLKVLRQWWRVQGRIDLPEYIFIMPFMLMLFQNDICISGSMLRRSPSDSSSYIPRASCIGQFVLWIGSCPNVQVTTVTGWETATCVCFCSQGPEAGQRDAGLRRAHKDSWLRHVQRKHARRGHHENLLWNAGLHRSWGAFSQLFISFIPLNGLPDLTSVSRRS